MLFKSMSEVMNKQMTHFWSQPQVATTGTAVFDTFTWFTLDFNSFEGIF